MGKTAILSVDILADARDATAGFKEAGDAAGTTADKIDSIGGKAGDTATGLGALAGALDAAGFGPAADALGLMATGLDATEGATTLFKVAQESLTISTLKDTAAKIKNTASTVASTVATKAASAAAKAWTAVQWLLNAAMTANPIGLIIAGIVALIAVIVLIATKTTIFQTAWTVAWGAIKTAAKAVWDWLSGAAETAMSLVVWWVKHYLGLFETAWDGIKTAVNTIWEWMKTAAATAMEIVTDPVDTLKDAWDAVSTAIEGVIEWLGKITFPEVLKNIGDAIGDLTPWSTGATGAGVRSFGGPVAGLTRAASSSASGHAGINITITGALDAPAVARQVRSILRTDDRRRRGVFIGAPA